MYYEIKESIPLHVHGALFKKINEAITQSSGVTTWLFD